MSERITRRFTIEPAADGGFFVSDVDRRDGLNRSTPVIRAGTLDECLDYIAANLAPETLAVDMVAVRSMAGKAYSGPVPPVRGDD